MVAIILCTSKGKRGNKSASKQELLQAQRSRTYTAGAGSIREQLETDMMAMTSPFALGLSKTTPPMQAWMEESTHESRSPSMIGRPLQQNSQNINPIPAAAGGKNYSQVPASASKLSKSGYEQVDLQPPRPSIKSSSSVYKSSPYASSAKPTPAMTRLVQPALFPASLNAAKTSDQPSQSLSREQTEQMAKHKVLTDSLKQYEGRPLEVT